MGLLPIGNQKRAVYSSTCSRTQRISVLSSPSTRPLYSPKINSYIRRSFQRILIFPILDILTGHDGSDDAFKNEVSEGGDGDGMANVFPHVYEDLKESITPTLVLTIYIAHSLYTHPNDA